MACQYLQSRDTDDPKSVFQGSGLPLETSTVKCHQEITIKYAISVLSIQQRSEVDSRPRTVDITIKNYMQTPSKTECSARLLASTFFPFPAKIHLPF